MFVRNIKSLDKSLELLKGVCVGLLNKSDKGVDIEIKEHKTKRSILQNAFYWANCNDIAKFLNDSGLRIDKLGVKCLFNKDDIHDINKQHTGIESTTKFSMSEFCEFMENFFVFWIDRTRGFWIPKETAESYLTKTGIVKNERE